MPEATRAAGTASAAMDAGAAQEEPSATQRFGELFFRWGTTVTAVVWVAILISLWLGMRNDCTRYATETICAARGASSGIDGILFGYIGFAATIVPVAIFAKTTYDRVAGLLALMGAGVMILPSDIGPVGLQRLVAALALIVLSLATLGLKEWVAAALKKDPEHGARVSSLMPLFGLLFAAAFVAAVAVS